MQVSFKYGTFEELEKREIEPGNFYVITDTSEMYFDSLDGQRMSLGKMDSISNEELDLILTI